MASDSVFNGDQRPGTHILFSTDLFCSGGKDSCYNMMQCIAEGHQIVALANLRPDENQGKCMVFFFFFKSFSKWLQLNFIISGWYVTVCFVGT